MKAHPKTRLRVDTLGSTPHLMTPWPIPAALSTAHRCCPDPSSHHAGRCRCVRWSTRADERRGEDYLRVSTLDRRAVRNVVAIDQCGLGVEHKPRSCGDAAAQCCTTRAREGDAVMGNWRRARPRGEGGASRGGEGQSRKERKGAGRHGERRAERASVDLDLAI